MTDWTAANLRLRADREAMNEVKRREGDARKREQAAEHRRQALAALARDGRE